MPELDDSELLRDTIQGLHNGDFSRLEPRFTSPKGAESQFVRWHQEGRFANDPKAVAEALSCACFLGLNDVAEYLLSKGVDLKAGAATGMDAFHWAVNRGQLHTVRMLLRHCPNLEARNSLGTTALGTAVWSAIHEKKPAHMEIIRELLSAGALVANVEFPAGHAEIDALLKNSTTRPFGGVSPVLRVSDASASRDYYVRCLGFKVDFEAPGFVGISRGLCSLYLCEDDQGHPGSWVWIDGKDVDAVYQEFKASGAKIRHPPTNYSWALEMQVEDLDGNVLRLGSDPREGEPDGEWLDMHGHRWLNGKRID